MTPGAPAAFAPLNRAVPGYANNERHPIRLEHINDN